jgi:hypothetical protein
MRSKSTRSGWRDGTHLVFQLVFQHPFKADWTTQDGDPQASGLQYRQRQKP